MHQDLRDMYIHLPFEVPQKSQKRTILFEDLNNVDNTCKTYFSYLKGKSQEPKKIVKHFVNIR